MISKIITENFMGAVGRISTEVQKYTAFVGRNGSGKSTRLNAVIVTLQGYLSDELGRKPIKTMEMARADKMITGVELDGGSRYERVFERKGKRVSSFVRIDGSDTAQREGDGIIKSELGDFPVMFNLAEFEALSPDKKKQFLFSISGSIKDIDNKDQFFGSLRYELMKQVIDEVTPNNLLEFKMGVKSFDDLPEEKYEEYFDVLNGQIDSDVVEYIDMVIEDFTELFTPAPQVLFDTLLKKTSEEESYQRKAVRDTDATRTKLAEVSAGLDGKKQELEGINDDIKSNTELKEKLIAKIASNEVNLLRIGDHERMVGKLREKIEDDEAFIEDNKDLTELVESIGILEADVGAATVVKSNNRNSLDILAEDYKKAIEESAKFIAIKSKFTDLKESINALDGTCVISKLIPCSQDFTSIITDADNAIADADRSIGPLKLNTEALRVDIDTLVDSMNSDSAAFADMESTLGENKRILSVTEDRRKSILETIEKTKAELVELDLQKMPVVFDKELLGAELTGYKTKLVILEDRRIAINRAEATFNQLNDTILKARSSSEKLAVALGLKATIQSLRNQLLGKAVKPLVKSVTGLMQKIDPTFDVMFDMDPGFGIRVLRNETWQPFSSLSGGEYLIFMAGLLTALIVTGDPELKVLLLEAAELDKENMELVMNALPVVTESLDNVFVAYPDHDVADVDGWLVNRM